MPACLNVRCGCTKPVREIWLLNAGESLWIMTRLADIARRCGLAWRSISPDRNVRGRASCINLIPDLNSYRNGCTAVRETLFTIKGNDVRNSPHLMLIGALSKNVLLLDPDSAPE